jgi:hypothetical protein
VYRIIVSFLFAARPGFIMQLSEIKLIASKSPPIVI